MSKKLIPVLVFAMAMALLGLIAVQAFWMREAFKMKADEFDRSVSEALKSTNYALEAREASRLFANNLDQKQLVSQLDSLAGPVLYTYDTVESVINPRETAKRLPKSATYSFSTSYPSKLQNEGRLNSLPTDCVVTIKSQAFQTIDNLLFDFSNKLDPRLEAHYRRAEQNQLQQARQFYQISIDMDSVLDIWSDSLQLSFEEENLFHLKANTSSLFYPLNKNEAVYMDRGDSSGSKNSQKKTVETRSVKPFAHLGTPTAKKQIVQKKLRIDSLLNKVAFDFISPKQPIEQRIAAAEFDSILSANLRQQGIKTPFLFQVIRESKDSTQLIYGDILPEAGYYEAKLFPNDMFNLNERLLVYFPHPTTFLLGNLLGMLLVSFALILVLIIIFFVTITVLLRQKKLSDMKSDFINNMTHEFKTPLATINLAADALANPKVQHNNELTTKYLGIIKTENKRMNIHVEQVLQTAQMERQELKLNLQRLDLRNLLEHAIALMEMQYDNRQAKLQLSCSHESCFIDGDESHLLNVFTNLLDNALKYAKTNPEVTVSASIVGQKAVIRVKDNGIGMNRETRQHVFEKFYRLPTGNVHNIKGFGLGLSYVKAIVDAHKGNISVESEIEIGSTFIVSLPLSTN